MKNAPVSEMARGIFGKMDSGSADNGFVWAYRLLLFAHGDWSHSRGIFLAA